MHAHALLVQALETALAAYRLRHDQCTNSTSVPGKYVVMSMVDEYAGLGNQFPGIITGVRCIHFSLISAGGPVAGLCQPCRLSRP